MAVALQNTSRAKMVQLVNSLRFLFGGILGILRKMIGTVGLYTEAYAEHSDKDRISQANKQSIDTAKEALSIRGKARNEKPAVFKG